MRLAYKVITLLLVLALAAGCSNPPSPQTVANGVTGSCGQPDGFADVSWSPDGTQIAYVLFPPNGNGQIYSMNVATQRTTQLTDNPDGDISPAWSPDGKQIAFVSGLGRQIFIMNSDGTGRTRLDDSSNDATPVWSPDGWQISFVSGWFGRNEIFLIGRDGSLQTRLTRFADVEGAPVWSADGTRIIYHSIGDPSGIFAIDLAGGEGAPLAAAQANLPALSPDGKRLAYTAPFSGADGLYVMDADPGRAASGSHPIGLTASASFVTGPHWMPDGQSLLFDARQSGDADIFRINADGSGQTALTSGSDDNTSPVVSPDGRTIVFLSTRGGGATDIYRMDADGGHQTRLTNNPGNQRCLKWPF